MDIWKFFSIGLANHVFCNPMHESKFDEMIGLLQLAPEDRILDMACGKAEFLLRVAQKWGCGGVGVDLSPAFVADARAKLSEAGVTGTIEIVEAEGGQYDAPPASFRLSACLGASWIWGGYAGMVDAMAKWTIPGGFVLLGEPFWRKEPSAEYLEAAGFKPTSFDTHAGNIRTGFEKGLLPLHAIVSSQDDWDRYEGYQWNAVETYAMQHPDDPDLADLLTGMRKSRDQYLRWGRDELGWAIYLFAKPQAVD